MRGRLALLSGGGASTQTLTAPLAGDDHAVYPPGLIFGQALTAPLAGGDAVVFPADVDYGTQYLAAPLAGTDSEAFAAALKGTVLIPAPLAGTDATVFPAGLDVTLFAPLAGVDAAAFPGVLFRDQHLLAPLAESGAWVYPAAVRGSVETAAASADGITVKSFTRAGALLAELDLAHGKAYTDQVDDTGVGSVTVQNDDPDYAHTGFDRLLRFYLGGEPRFASLVEGRDVVTLDSNGGAEEITRLSGRGALALLDEGIVGPSRGVGALPIEIVRSFSWPSPDFDDTPWPWAKKIMRVTDPDLFYGIAWPESWPDQSAWWIWADRDDCSSADAPQGTCLFRYEFTMPAAGWVSIFAGFDNRGELFVDGAQLLQSNGAAEAFTRPRRVEVYLSAGVHYLAARVENFGDDGSLGPEFANPGRFVCSVYSTDTTGLLDTLLFNTNTDWQCLPYPVTEPGFTNGQVLRILLEEFQAEGACSNITLGCTDFLDSAGNPWPVETEITTNNGRTFLEIAQEMAGSTADIAMAPGALVLRAWRFGERGITRPITLAAGSNLAGLSHAGKRTTVNAVLVLWAGGWLEELDAASITANGRRGVFLDLSAVQSEAKARALARETMGLRSSPRYAVTGDVDPASALEAQALNALEPGDTITHPDETLTADAGRVRAVTVEEITSGRVDRTVRVNDVAEEAEVRHDRWLRRMAPGALAGGSRVAAPAGQPQPSDRMVSAVRVGEISFEGTVSAASAVRLVLNGAYVGAPVTFASGDEQRVTLGAQRVLANLDHLQIEVDGVLSQRRPVEASGNLIEFAVTRTAAADGTAGLDAQARAI